MARRASNGMDTQTKKHHQVLEAKQAGTSSAFVKPVTKPVRAPAVPPPPPSTNSQLESWTTVSLPKSILRGFHQTHTAEKEEDFGRGASCINLPDIPATETFITSANTHRDSQFGPRTGATSRWFHRPALFQTDIQLL
ncbi:hypothetical protein FRB94_008966 [Tulasnella sp. JGI-2019a]|nr:hypothetical protein FRB94_008966 [Tulasnella sp. JGI-2019a]